MKVFDCDIHQTYKSQEDLFPFLASQYVDRIRNNGLGYPASPYHSPLSYKRKDATPPSGPAGSDMDFLRKQLFEEMGVNGGILNGSGMFSVSYIPEIEYPVHLARAYNEWMIHEWLEKDDRFFGSLHIALQNPEASAQMIRDLGRHKQIVQVIVSSMTQLPMSHFNYKPILKAVEDTGLAIAFHIWQPSITTHASTPLGNPMTYVEWKTLSGLPNIAHLINLIMTGVFEEFPKLRCVFLEGGYGWLTYFKFRMEQLYKSFRSDVPWLKKSPEYYLNTHCRFVTQPIEEYDKELIEPLFKAMNGDKLIMYSSDYPHWDADNPSHAMKNIPAAMREAIMYRNAEEFYNIKI